MTDRPDVVQLFVTCLVDGFYPEVGEATVAVLERLGIRVEFPFDQTCCGQPAYNAGFRDEAVAMARHTVRVLDATAGPIVVPSGSCTDMIVHHAVGILEGDPAHAAAVRVAERVRELTSFLVDDLGVEDVAATGAGTVTYHASCHGLRGLGLTDQGPRLLDAVDGLERVPLEGVEECCGFGGLFSVKLPEVSAAMMETKLDAIEATGAGVVTATDVSCLMHIAGGLRRRGSEVVAAHIARLLDGETP